MPPLSLAIPLKNGPYSVNLDLFNYSDSRKIGVTSIPTVVDLDENELAELRTYTRQSDDAAALRSAMTDYLRYIRRMELKGLSGKVEMEDNWKELEAAEIKETSDDDQLRAR